MVWTNRSNKITKTLMVWLAIAAVALAAGIPGLSQLPGSEPSVASAANITITQCEGIENGGGRDVTCTVTVDHTIVNGVITGSTVSTNRCVGPAAGVLTCPPTGPTASGDAVTLIQQCGGPAGTGSGNGGGSNVKCDVIVTNTITGAIGGAVATVSQCVGSGTGGGIGTGGVAPATNCTSPPPGALDDPTATIHQCAGSGNGGGGDNRVICSAPTGGTTLTTPVIQQCNGSGNGGGATVKCTAKVTNNILPPPAGTIVVNKITIPAGDSQPFVFTAGGGTYAGFTLNAATVPSNSQTQVPGAGYSVSEAAVAGWNQTSASCTGAGNTPAAITVVAGATVTCTFTNTKRGTITVDKVTSPGADPQSFDFTTTGAGYVPFSLTDAAAPNSQSLVPGAYSVTEAGVAGWGQTSATCSGGNAPAAIVLVAGATVSCTFTNTKQIPPPAGSGGGSAPAVFLTPTPTVTRTPAPSATPTATQQPAAPTAVPPTGGGIGVILPPVQPAVVIGPLVPFPVAAPQAPAPVQVAPAQVVAPRPEISLETGEITLDTGRVETPVALPNAGGPVFPLGVPAGAGLALAGAGILARRWLRKERP